MTTPPAECVPLNDVPGVAVVVEKAVGTKCARSWKILPTVGEDAEYPDVTPRDAQACASGRRWGYCLAVVPAKAGTHTTGARQTKDDDQS